jgi:hypothetical protein
MLGLFVWYGGFIGAAGAHVMTTNDTAVPAVVPVSCQDLTNIGLVVTKAVMSADQQRPLSEHTHKKENPYAEYPKPKAMASDLLSHHPLRFSIHIVF